MRPLLCVIVALIAAGDAHPTLRRCYKSQLGEPSYSLQPPILVIRRPVLLVVDSSDGLLTTYTQRGLSLTTEDPTADVVCREIIKAYDWVAILIAPNKLPLLKTKTVIKGLNSLNVNSPLSDVEPVQSPWLILSRRENLLVDPYLLDQVYIRIHHHDLEPWDMPAYTFPGTSASLAETAALYSDISPLPAPAFAALCVSPDKPRPFPVLFAPPSSPLAAFRPQQTFVDLSGLTPAVVGVPASQLTAIISGSSLPENSTQAGNTASATSFQPLSTTESPVATTVPTSTSISSTSNSQGQFTPSVTPSSSNPSVSSTTSSSSEGHSSSGSFSSPSVHVPSVSASISETSGFVFQPASSVFAHRPQVPRPSQFVQPMFPGVNAMFQQQIQPPSGPALPFFVGNSGSGSSGSAHSSNPSQTASFQPYLNTGHNSNAGLSAPSSSASSLSSTTNQGITAPAGSQSHASSASYSSSLGGNFQYTNNPNVLSHAGLPNLSSATSSSSPSQEQFTGNRFSSNGKPITTYQHSSFPASNPSTLDTSRSKERGTQGGFQVLEILQSSSIPPQSSENVKFNVPDISASSFLPSSTPATLAPEASSSSTSTSTSTTTYTVTPNDQSSSFSLGSGTQDSLQIAGKLPDLITTLPTLLSPVSENSESKLLVSSPITKATGSEASPSSSASKSEETPKAMSSNILSVSVDVTHPTISPMTSTPVSTSA